MSKPIHTPGPVRVFAPFGRPEIVTDRNTAYETQPVVTQFGQPNADANARLLAASYNAFDSAARKLNCNAVELAERMADGGLLKLIEAVKAARQLDDWFMEHSRQADHAHEELKQPLHETAGWKELVDAGYNGLMASYHQQFEEALALVKGDAA